MPTTSSVRDSPLYPTHDAFENSHTKLSKRAPAANNDTEIEGVPFELDPEVLEDFCLDEEELRQELEDAEREGFKAIRHEKRCCFVVAALDEEMESVVIERRARRERTKLLHASQGPEGFNRRKARAEHAKAMGVVLASENGATFGNFLGASATVRSPPRTRPHSPSDTPRAVLSPRRTPRGLPSAAGSVPDPAAKPLHNGSMNGGGVSRPTSRANLLPLRPESRSQQQNFIGRVGSSLASPSSAAASEPKKKQRKMPLSLSDHIKLHSKATRIGSASSSRSPQSMSSSRSPSNPPTDTPPSRPLTRDGHLVLPESDVLFAVDDPFAVPADALKRMLGSGRSRKQRESLLDSGLAGDKDGVATSDTAAFYASATQHTYPNELKWPDWREERKMARRKAAEEALQNNHRRPHSALDGGVLGGNKFSFPSVGRPQSSLTAGRSGGGGPQSTVSIAASAALRVRRISDCWRVKEELVAGGGISRAGVDNTPLHNNDEAYSLNQKAFVPFTQQGTFADAFYRFAGGDPSTLRHAIEAQRLVSAKCASIDDVDPNGQRAAARGVLIRPPSSKSSALAVVKRIVSKTGADPSSWTAAEQRAIRRGLQAHDDAVFDASRPMTAAYLKRAAAAYEQGPRVIKRYIPPAGFCVTTNAQREAARKAARREAGVDSDDE